jgi:diadenosine tetraphosphatase ApaH/serine/threonine PP2A family protein phosphatase
MELRSRAAKVPERLALMGGAYGNVPGLKACINDARRLGCDLLIFLGDATGCCGHSDETLALLRQNFQVLIQGNHEEEAIAGSEACACGYGDPDDERYGCMAHQFAMTSLSEKWRVWMTTWPKQAVLEIGSGRLLLCHGSPDRINEFLYESELDENRLTGWLEKQSAAALACTHTGLPWLRQLARGQLAFNCGTVGKPDNDGDPAVHYAFLHASKQLPWTATIRRVEYDHRAWVAQLKREGVDPIFTEPLRIGWWTTGVKSLPALEKQRAREGRRTAEIASGLTDE